MNLLVPQFFTCKIDLKDIWPFLVFLLVEILVGFLSKTLIALG